MSERKRTKADNLTDRKTVEEQIQAPPSQLDKRALEPASEPEAAKTAEQHLAFLAEAGRLPADALDNEQILTNIAHLIVPYLADWCVIDMLDESRQSHRIIVTHTDLARQAVLGKVDYSFYESSDRYAPDQPLLVSNVTEEDLAHLTHNVNDQELLKHVGLRSLMIVPLTTRGRTIGHLVLATANSRRTYTHTELTLAEDLARRAATAIDNARLYREAQQAIRERDRVLAEAELLNSIAVAASGEKSLERILSVALDRLANLIRFTGGSFAVVEGNDLVIRAARGPFTGTALGQRLPYGIGQSWQVVLNRKPFLCNDLLAAGLGSKSIQSGATMRSYLAVPLTWQGVTFGLLEVDSTFPDAFTPDDMRLVQKVALTISGSIEVARRYEAEVKALALAEAERSRLKEIFMRAPALICMTRGPEHIFEFANPIYMQVVGNRDITGKPIREALPELETQGFFDLLNQVYTTGTTITGNETPVQIDRDGNGILEEAFFNFVYQPRFDANHKVDGIIVYAVEVTEQVRARHRVEELAVLLGQQADRLNTIIEAMPDGVYVTDAEGNMIMVNPKGAEFVGMSIDQTYRPLENFRQTNELRYPDGSMIPPSDYPLARALAGQTGTDYHILIRQLGTGQLIHLRLSYAPIYDRSGKLSGAVAVASDISELQRLEQQKDEFLSVASHELKTPITSIKGLTQMAMRRLKRAGQPELAASFQIVDDQINRLIHLVNDLLDVSRIQTGRMEMYFELFDLAGLVRGASEAMQATTERHHLIVVTPEHLELNGDADRLEQVITNLLSNAIKYSPNGGDIEITLRQAGTNAEISIRDYGIGIPEQDRAKLFERFHRASNAGEHQITGFGIGLYISNRIVRAHGGRIWFDAAALPAGERGSCFRVVLPLDHTPDDAEQLNYK